MLSDIENHLHVQDTKCKASYGTAAVFRIVSEQDVSVHALALFILPFIFFLQTSSTS